MVLRLLIFLKKWKYIVSLDVLIFILPVILLINSCSHKEICEECYSNEIIEVIFDWKYVLNRPEGMRVLFYNTSGNLVYSYNMPTEGQRVNILPGKYTVVTFNNDSEYLYWNGITNINTLNASTRNGTIYEEYSRQSDDEADPDTGQTIKVMPDKLYSAVNFNQVIKPACATTQTIVLTPQDQLDRYTYELGPVNNIDKIIDIKATLSGMAGCYSPIDPTRQCEPVTIPMVDNRIDKDENILTGTLLNYGTFTGAVNTLTIYIKVAGGTIVEKYNVTQQIIDAPNKTNVIIRIIDEITTNLPIDYGSGIDPSVDPWGEEINEDIIL